MSINKNNIIINGINININNVPENIVIISDIIKYIKKTKNKLLDYSNYFIIFNGKIIDNNSNINIILNDNNILNNSSTYKIYKFDIYERQYGGGSIIGDLVNGIVQIFTLFKYIFSIIKWIGNFLIWLIKFVVWFFTDFLNPGNLSNEFFQSLMIIVLAICKAPLDILMSLFSGSINTVGGWMQGFWGWDMSNLTETDRQSNYFKNINKRKGEKCYLTNGNTVPFSIILGTILCPPIGVFMDLGLTGWINILICILLTLLYYVPGLIYALLVIYS
jgi:uncharacterized membrane protein YqaE (UPF0057 family)